jgi:hypothetical protein
MRIDEYGARTSTPAAKPFLLGSGTIRRHVRSVLHESRRPPQELGEGVLVLNAGPL